MVSESPAVLTARGAFVIQVDDAAELHDQGLGGRVEHVVTGKSAVFTSSGALLAFILDALRGAGPATDGGALPEE